MPEIIKSDIFRLECILKHGGIWFDMDTFWINKIGILPNVSNKNKTDVLELYKWYNATHYENLENNEDSDINENLINNYFVFCNDQQNENLKNNRHFCQYITIGNTESKIFNELYKNSLSELNIEMYESVGTQMFNKIVSKELLKFNQNSLSALFVNIDKFAPYKWHQMNELFIKNK